MTDDIRDRIRAWATEYLFEKGYNEMFSPPPNHLTKAQLAAALLEHLPASDGTVTPGAIAADEARRRADGAAYLAWFSDRTARDAEAAAWNAANPGGTRERPVCVEAARRVCLVRTDADEWAVVDHGGWTETAGSPIGSFTMGYMDGADWYPTETEARAAYRIASGQISDGDLAKLVANSDAVSK